MVFGLFASVANDLMFLSVQVRLLLYLLYLLRSTYLSCTVDLNTCYGPLTCLVLCILIPRSVFSRFRSCGSGTVRHGCERTVFGLDLDGVRPFRIRRQRPHVFVCAGSVASIPAIPATVHLPVLYCGF